MKSGSHISTLLMIATAVTILPGCVAGGLLTEATGRVNAYLQCVHERQQIAFEHMRMHREADTEQLRIEHEQLRDELRDEQERLRVESQVEREALRTRYDERLQTQLGLQMTQQLQLGELQVDMSQLEKLVAARKAENEAIEKAWQHLETQRKEQARQEALVRAHEAMRKGDEAGAREALAACGCGPRTEPNCAEPVVEKVRRQESLSQPVARPILPTEIPLVIPVSLKVELGGPAVGPSAVRRIPQQPSEALKRCRPASVCAPPHVPGHSEQECEDDSHKAGDHDH